MNGVVFLILFSEDLSLMNRNATDLCVVILYPTIFLNLFIFSKILVLDVFWWIFMDPVNTSSCSQQIVIA